jgi:hypothetical protein
MALKDVDLESALRRLAERRIEEAMREGKFDNLAGAGRPIELEPLPADENARAMWWALKILRQNDVIPEEVKWRKTIDQLKARLATARDESAVRSLVAQINGLVRQLNNLGTNAINVGVGPVLLDEALAAFRQRQSGNGVAASVGHCANHLCGTSNPSEARFCRRCGAPLNPA